MDLHKEATFGRVLSVLRASSYEEAIRLVKGKPLGQRTAIFTNDGGAARRAATSTRLRSAWPESTSLRQFRLPTSPSAAGRPHCLAILSHAGLSPGFPTHS
jgi:hypothetical protein